MPPTTRGASTPSMPTSTACRSRSSPARARRSHSSPARPRPASGPSPTRIACEITWPRLLGYRYEVPGERLTATFNADSQLALTNADIPTKTGTSRDRRRGPRPHARRPEGPTAQRSRLPPGQADPRKIFPRRRRDTTSPGSSRNSSRSPSAGSTSACTARANTFPQLLLFAEIHPPRRRSDLPLDRPIDRRGRRRSSRSSAPTRPSARPATSISTRSGRHTRPGPTSATSRTSSLDSDWEAKLAQELEDMDEVVAYVKNQSLGFTIPYTINGVERQYYPDFIVRIDDGDGRTNRSNLIIEVTGERKKDKEAKTATARTLWVPAVNNHGGFGRWAFLEITDPYDDCAELIRADGPRRCAGDHDGGRSDGTQEERPDPRPYRNSTPSATKRPARTSRPRNFATSSPTDETDPAEDALSPRPVARPATRLEGEGRARPRTARSRCRPDLHPGSHRAPGHHRRRRGRKTTKPDNGGFLPGFFDDFEAMEFDHKVEFYQHDQHWANRMILGNSLQVMTSLAEKEGLKGKVQMIYIDPPYGIKFGSNWQVSTRNRDVKDGKIEDTTRQPEQILAFRDTWKIGIHSYLAYLRDRLDCCSGIADRDRKHISYRSAIENVHLVRSFTG